MSCKGKRPPFVSEGFESQLISTVAQIFRARQCDPEVWFEVDAAWWSERQNAATGRCFSVLNVRIKSNAPDVLRGNFSHLRHAGVIGFNTVYLQGFLDSWLHSVARGLADRIDVQVDVVADRSRRPIKHPRYLSVREALSCGVVKSGSPVETYCRKYGLTKVSLFGPGLIGPSTEMIAAIEKIWEVIRAKSVLDLFSGTGALGRVCRTLGAKTVVSVDELPASKSGSTATDAFRLDIGRRVDLAILDQFVEQTDVVAQRLIPILSRNANCLLWNLGPAAHSAHFGWLKRKIIPWYRPMADLRINDCMISLFSSTQLIRDANV